MSVASSNSMKTYPLTGGIYPPERKTLSNHTPIQPVPLAKHYIIPLQQSLGAPAKPCVTVGQKVLKGQLLATPNGLVSAAAHAPTSGTIQAIEARPYPHPSGEDSLAIVLDADGHDQWAELQPITNYQLLDKAELLERIRWAGISGLGGAGFPTAVKVASNQPIHTLIINGAECEPYITADDRLMRERADLLVQGIEILAHLIEPQQILLGIEDNKPEAIAAVRAAVAERPIQVVSFPTKYPSGGEKQLIQILLGQEVPHGQLPADIGVLCQNVGTAVAIAEAINQGKPLISRITTLTGDAFYSPTNVEALIGTPIEHLLNFAGLNQQRLHRLIMGGPMMGFTLLNTQAPVIKTTNCLLAATADELPAPAPAMPCIRCGDCAQVCPVSLLPQQLHFYALGNDHEQLQAHDLFDCIECGACAYVCPSSIPLVQYYRAAKAEIRDAERKLQKAEHARIRFEQRQERLRLEEERKEAERQARAERAAQARAASSKVAPTASQAPSTDHDEQLKRLKIEASMARVALTKAQKQLAEHGTEALQAQVQQLEQVASAAQAAYQQAAAKQPSAAPSSQSPSDAELKKAKIDVAMAKANLRKAERNQAPAEELVPLQQLLDQAEQALAALTSTSATTAKASITSQDDATLKKAKIDLAMAKANLRKAERANADQVTLDSLSQTLIAAEQQVKALTTTEATSQPKATNATTDALKKAKIEVAMAKANLRKAERAEADPAEITRLQTLLTAAEAALKQHSTAENTSSSAGSARKPPAPDPLKQAKIALAMAKANLRKAERNQADAETLTQLQTELTQAERRLTELTP